MTTQLDKDNYFEIQLLSYHTPNEKIERFYFLEMSTLQVTTLLPKSTKIISSKIVAYTADNKYLDKTTAFKTIYDFNEFFELNPEYYLHNCYIEMGNGMIVSSHDDGEISIQFLRADTSNQIIIDTIFDKYNLDKKLIDILKNKIGHYITIDKSSNITGDFESFDDYLRNGQL